MQKKEKKENNKVKKGMGGEGCSHSLKLKKRGERKKNAKKKEINV